MIAHEGIAERQARLDAEVTTVKQNFDAHCAMVKSRFDVQDIILQELRDDLQLRKWLARFAKSAIFILAATLGILHAPAWLHKFFGVVK